MRELTYYIAASIDGRIAGPDDGFSMFSAEGDHMEAVTGRFRDALPGAALTALGLEPSRELFDTVIMGWNTYAVGLPVGIDDPYPHLRQYIASTRDPALPNGLTVTRDPVRLVRELKSEPEGAGIWLCGGGRLASTLADHIDRLIIKLNPVLIGAAGKPLFQDRVPPRLELTGTTAHDSSVVLQEYRVPRV